MRISQRIAGLACLTIFGASAHAQSASAQQGSLADRTIASYCAAWGTVDRGARDALVAQVWADGAEYVDPQPVRVVGRAALTAEIIRFQRENPGSTFRCSAVQAHHDFVRYTWIMVGADGVERFQGMDFGEFDASGRLVRIVSFFGAPPSDKK